MKETIFESSRAGYLVSTDRLKLDREAIHRFLSQSYWSPGLPIEILEKAIVGSICFGVYHEGAQIDFARVISDKATFAYLCDVYVLQEHRGQGLARLLMQMVMEHPELQGLRRMLLVTRDAHDLYGKFGFKPLSRPEGYMEIHHPTIYQTPKKELSKDGFTQIG